VLEDGLAKPESTFDYATEASLDGRKLQNAGGESCGGTLVQAFASSCNSVFAPLAAKLGSTKLVDMATRYGFNHSTPGVPGAAVSTIPTADKIVGDDATGSTGIGQGQTAASALQMTTTAATVGAGGFRAQPTLVKVNRPSGWRVTSPKVASDMRRLMLAVVRGGTGFAAAIPGVAVAGKTGTAELVDTTSPDVVAGDPKNTDAWFVAFAPAWNARIAVGVELDGAGHGGDSAAPAAHDVLVAALQNTR
jgi:cell division protein FtsI/penicillin-binding protein 2